ncbi:MAG TPA: tetratricopeptide repeat protein [Longimicrobium sp.]|nr:tetratricopeptide repeat protein [Longimicrobium sp.]
MKALRIAAAAALLPLAGCLATKQDLQTLQTRMDNDRAAQNRQIEQLITRTQAMLDSLSSQNARMRADVANRLQQLDRQLVQIQSLSGQSQQQIRDLQRQIETRTQEAREAQEAAADSTEAVIDRPAPERQADAGTSGRTTADRPSTTTDRTPARPSTGAADRPSSTTAASPPPRATTPRPTTPARPRPSGGGPTADEAYETAMGAFRRGSLSTARNGFQEFLTVAPDDPRAADAQYHIGETYTRDPDAAIAAYQRVVSRWPESERAPAALLRIARLEIARGERTQARAHLNQILRSYSRSDEAEEARTQLARLGSR